MHNFTHVYFFHRNAVGMGAVFLTIVQGITRYEAQKHVNIKKMVRLLRKGQAGAIENFDQYKFIYDVSAMTKTFNELLKGCFILVAKVCALVHHRHFCAKH